MWQRSKRVETIGNARGRLVSISVAREKAKRKRTGQDLQVQQQRPVLDVVEIVLNSLSNVGATTQAVDLRPSGHSRFDHVAELIARDPAPELSDEDRPFRAR